MDYDSRITGQIIGMLRTRRGISQEVLSGFANLARSHLAMIENGSKNASVSTLWRIASALGIRLSELIRMIEDETGKTAPEQQEKFSKLPTNYK